MLPPHTRMLRATSRSMSSPSHRKLLGHFPLRTPSRLLACPPEAPPGAPQEPIAFPLGALSAHHAAVCSSGLGEQVFPLFQPCTSSGHCQHQSSLTFPLSMVPVGGTSLVPVLPVQRDANVFHNRETVDNWRHRLPRSSNFGLQQRPLPLSVGEINVCLHTPHAHFRWAVAVMPRSVAKVPRDQPPLQPPSHAQPSNRHKSKWVPRCITRCWPTLPAA